MSNLRARLALFTARDMQRFVLVEGDEPFYREVEKAESEADPYRW